MVQADRETTSIFIRDIMTKFQLTSPTILYDKDEEAPEICYTEQWVLCLPIENHDSKESENVRAAAATTTKKLNDGMQT